MDHRLEKPELTVRSRALAPVVSAVLPCASVSPVRVAHLLSRSPAGTLTARPVSARTLRANVYTHTTTLSPSACLTRALVRRHAGWLRDQVLRGGRGHRVPLPDHPTRRSHGPHVPAGRVALVLHALPGGQALLNGTRRPQRNEMG